MIIVFTPGTYSPGVCQQGNSMKDKMQNHLKKASVTCSRIYAALMLSLFIFAFHNNYIDIQDFKSKLFLSMTAVYLILEVLLLLPCFLHLQGHSRKQPVFPKKPFEKSRLVFPLMFAAALLCGWLFSEWPSEAAWGSSGRQMGAIPLLLCVLVYFVLSLTFEYSHLLTVVFAVSVAAQILLGILNLWGLDPLGMYINLIDEQHAFFIGTIGSKNVTATYLCLVMPVLAAWFALAKGWRTYAYAILLFLGFYYGLGVSSDSFLIGMAAAFAVMLWHGMSGSGDERLSRLHHAAAVFGLYYAAALAMSATVRLVRSPFMLAFPHDGLIGNALKPTGLVMTGAAGALLIIWTIMRERKQDPADLLPVRNTLFSVLAGAAVLLIIFAVIINFLPTERKADLPVFLRRFILTDSFGSNRGYIWKRSAEVFAGLPFIKKLIGVGADCFYLLMMPLYGNEMTILYGAPFADAHNEFLQFLVTTGILGVTGYFGTMLTGCFRNHADRTGAQAGQVCRMVIAAYIAQGMVNNPMIMTTPLLFIFLAVCHTQQRDRN